MLTENVWVLHQNTFIKLMFSAFSVLLNGFLSVLERSSVLGPLFTTVFSLSSFSAELQLCFYLPKWNVASKCWLENNEVWKRGDLDFSSLFWNLDAVKPAMLVLCKLIHENKSDSMWYQDMPIQRNKMTLPWPVVGVSNLKWKESPMFLFCGWYDLQPLKCFRADMTSRHSGASPPAEEASWPKSTQNNKKACVANSSQQTDFMMDNSLTDLDQPFINEKDLRFLPLNQHRSNRFSNWSSSPVCSGEKART